MGNIVPLQVSTKEKDRYVLWKHNHWLTFSFVTTQKTAFICVKKKKEERVFFSVQYGYSFYIGTSDTLRFY